MNAFLKNIKGDRGIWLIIFLLSIFSTLAVYSSVVTIAFKKHGGNPLPILSKHVIILSLGLAIIYFIHKIRFTYFSRIAQLSLFISVPLLLLTLLMGTNLNDASRWLTIPIINQSFQTSDLAKIALIMYIARILSMKQDNIKDFKQAFLPVVLPVILICGLILPANFSTAAVLFSSSVVLMFIGRLNMTYILAMLGLGVVAIFLIFLTAKAFPEVLPRAQTWMNRVENFQSGDDKGNYQSDQSKIAIATGGLYGKGPGNSTQRNFLPHPYSDFIYAIILEEYGMVGGLFTLFLYLVLLFRAVRIVIRCDKPFGALLVIGIAFLLVFQALINMAVAVNLLPVTGQPLPLLSMGGTSIWFTCVALGVILSVSRYVEGEEEKDDKEYAKV